MFTIPFVSYGAAKLVGWEAIAASNSGGNLSMPQLAEEVGGDFLLSFVSAVAFATILAALSRLVIATTDAISHDIYRTLIKPGHVDHRKQFHRRPSGNLRKLPARPPHCSPGGGSERRLPGNAGDHRRSEAGTCRPCC
jgi:hypothetical protein